MCGYRRTMDCEVWAKKKIESLGISQDSLYLIEPPSGLNMKCLDDFSIVNNTNELVSIETGWTHHFTVFHEGKFYDEHYPEGIDEEVYMSRNVDNGLNIIRPYNKYWIEGDYQVTK